MLFAKLSFAISLLVGAIAAPVENLATKRETEVAARDEDALPYSPTVYRIKSGEEVAKREAEELAARDDDAVTYNPAVYVVD